MFVRDPRTVFLCLIGFNSIYVYAFEITMCWRMPTQSCQWRVGEEKQQWMHDLDLRGFILESEKFLLSCVGRMRVCPLVWIKVHGAVDSE